jgi:hypothetical protein
MKEKEARCNEKIEEIQKEKADLEFKLQKLEEIIRKSEKRRGLRK